MKSMYGETNKVEELSKDGKLLTTLEESNLLWKVETQPLLILQDGKYNTVSKANAVVRTDANAILGIVGDRYTPVQNRDAFSLVDKFQGYDGVSLVNAGELENGAITWAQLSLNQKHQIQGEDLVDTYLTVVNSHDGNSSLKFILSPVRLWCMNMLLNVTEHSWWQNTLRHTKSINAGMLNFKETLDMTNDLILDSLKRYFALTKIEVKSQQMLDDYFTTLINGQIIQHFESSRQETIFKKKSEQ